MLCILIKILLHASVKQTTKRLMGFKFSHFYWSFSNDIVAVKGYGQKKVEEKKRLEKFFRLFVLVHNLTHSLPVSVAV